MAAGLLVVTGCGASPTAQPHPVPFRLLSADGRTLHLQVQTGGPPCDGVTGVDVRETRATVTVTVRAGASRDAQCGPGAAAVLGTFPVTARLREPLGARRLRDGAR